MRRKDGQPKTKSARNLPKFDGGFREFNPLPKPGCEAQKVVSFFTGCGGFDLGLTGGFRYLNRSFRRLPFETIAAYDILPDAIETYRLNIGSEIQECDLSQVDISQLPSSDLVIGGFPCQDFSSSGPKVGLNGKRGQLYTVIRDYIEVHQPKIFIAENVPYLMRLGSGKYLSQIISEFGACGYRVAVWQLNCPDFGLPQSRKRIFIVGVRNDLAGFPAKPTGQFSKSIVPIDFALNDLVEVLDEKVPNQGQFFVSSRATGGGGQGDHANQAGKVAYCIRANSRGRIQFHYSLDRRLTVRECARLQSFPDDFVFPFTTQRNLTLIGNAVPPIIAHAVGESIFSYLGGQADDDTQIDSFKSDWYPTPEQIGLKL